MGDVTPAIPFPVIERRLAAARQQKEVSGEGGSHQQDISLCSVVRRWLTSQGGEVRSAGLSGGIAGGVENEVVREVRVKCKEAWAPNSDFGSDKRHHCFWPTLSRWHRDGTDSLVINASQPR